MIQILSTIGVKFFLIILSLIGSVVSARYLGPESRGDFFYWTSITALIIQFGSFGLQSSNTYSLIKRKVNISLILSNSLYVAIFSGSFGCFIAVLINKINGDNNFSIFTIPSILILSILGLNYLFLSNLLIAKNKIKEFNYIELISKICSISLCIITTIIWRNPIYVLYTLCLSEIFSLLVLIFLFKKDFKVNKPNLEVFRGAANFGFKAYTICTLSSLVPKINIFVLRPEVSAVSFGEWSVSAQMFDVLCIVPASISLLLFPKMLRDKNPLKLLKKYTILFTLFSLSFSFIFYKIGYRFLYLLYGEEYKSVYELLLWSLPGFLSYGIITLISQYLASKGFPKTIIPAWIIILITHFFITTHLIPIVGTAAPYLSMSISYFLGCGIFLLLVKRLSNNLSN